MRSDPWWRDHAITLEIGTVARRQELLRKLDELGYGRVGAVRQPGEFAVRGGIVDVFPINLGEPVRIEFSGNAIDSLHPIAGIAARAQKKIRLPDDATEYERLWLGDLKPGDYAVHVDHGIGVFRGFETGVRGEYYIIEYAPPRSGGKPDRLLVPQSQAKKLSRYIGFETPTIHRLGGTVWVETKRRAREDARRFAEELAEIYRARGQARRPAYPEDTALDRELSYSFPYEETDDQRRALGEIHADLSRDRPMDRLLLGDVGFGKTEIALRAAARVAASGKQVAVIAPTTILADQHQATFRERLHSLPFIAAALTRLTPKREVKKILEATARGGTDIMIGTHRLLSRDVSWRDLGLVIIDEEQRFGVRHKETIKKLRSEVDILSLSATPIPRTLSLALAKLRDLSLLQTPPPGRLPVETFVLPSSRITIREAIASELKRSGQIFYLWNRIGTIETVRRELERLAPKTRVITLHGRMREAAIIRAMHEFRSGNADILLATTIIENGLDLPNANTLIVADAARLGLAEAHQLRGRIGRGEVSARAYFLYRKRALTEKGMRRLEALRETSGLGAGFQIALRDLEIRGAGNVLGKQQSGTMTRVGLNLYAELLSEALGEISTDI